MDFTGGKLRINLGLGAKGKVWIDFEGKVQHTSPPGFLTSEKSSINVGSAVAKV